jgi:erythromycin esterase
MVGRGKAWFDGLEITLDGQPVAEPGLDLDFEGERHEGFRAPAQGYQVRLDRTVAKVGAQSLRIEGRPTADAGHAPAEAAAAWQGVVARLEQGRDRLKGREAELVALDWAIVNARLVKDSMDVKAGNRTARDHAMARMVAWILEQSPKARIVLWAHNGHVAREPGWMGRHLEDMFPGQMVVLGFATGDGSYRAVARSGKGIIGHGLMRPPADSFESAFQAAGLPVAIFDLRKAVKGSPESGFLLEKRGLRSIGAMEMPDRQFFPVWLRDSFDAVVWIEKTRASLPLTP